MGVGVWACGRVGVGVEVGVGVGVGVDMDVGFAQQHAVHPLNTCSWSLGSNVTLWAFKTLVCMEPSDRLAVDPP